MWGGTVNKYDVILIYFIHLYFKERRLCNNVWGETALNTIISFIIHEREVVNF